MLIAPLVRNIEKLFSSFSFFSFLYSKPYKKVVQKEISLANITASDTVLNIGCGAIPFTAVFLAQMTCAKIIAIDSDSVAVQKAKDFVKTQNLQNRIEVLHCAGEDYPKSDFTVVLMALQSKPKIKIILHLLSQTTKQIRFLVRTPLVSLTSEYDPMPSDIIFSSFATHKKMKTFDKTLLFTPHELIKYIQNSSSFQIQQGLYHANQHS